MYIHVPQIDIIILRMALPPVSQQMCQMLLVIQVVNERALWIVCCSPKWLHFDYSSVYFYITL